MIIWEYDNQTGIFSSSGESVFFNQDTTTRDIYKAIAPEHQETYLKAFDDILNKRSEF